MNLEHRLELDEQIRRKKQMTAEFKYCMSENEVTDSTAFDNIDGEYQTFRFLCSFAACAATDVSGHLGKNL